MAYKKIFPSNLDIYLELTILVTYAPFLLLICPPFLACFLAACCYLSIFFDSFGKSFPMNFAKGDLLFLWYKQGFGLKFLYATFIYLYTNFKNLFFLTPSCGDFEVHWEVEDSPANSVYFKSNESSAQISVVFYSLTLENRISRCMQTAEYWFFFNLFKMMMMMMMMWLNSKM